jgi:hypothetical protein
MQERRSHLIFLSFSEVRTLLPKLRKDIKRQGVQYLCTHYGVPKALLVDATIAKQFTTLPVKEMGVTEFRATFSVDADFTLDCIVVLTHHDRPTVALLPLSCAKAIGVDLGIYGEGDR